MGQGTPSNGASLHQREPCHTAHWEHLLTLFPLAFMCRTYVGGNPGGEAALLLQPKWGHPSANPVGPPAPQVPSFIRAARYKGPRKGYAFYKGEKGLGYHLDPVQVWRCPGIWVPQGCRDNAPSNGFLDVEERTPIVFFIIIFGDNPLACSDQGGVPAF